MIPDQWPKTMRSELENEEGFIGWSNVNIISDVPCTRRACGIGLTELTSGAVACADVPHEISSASHRAKTHSDEFIITFAFR